MKSNLLLTLAILVYSHTISYGQVTIVNDGGEVLLKSASGNGMHIDGDLYTNVLISVNDLVFRSNNTLSGRLNASSRNTSLGCWSLSKNTSGSNNSAIGHISLYRNTTGSFNTVIGKQSLCNGDTGSYNTSLGGSTLFANTSDSNTVVGAIAMQSNTTGNQNTCLGSWSMWSNSTGTGNTVAGSNTLNSNSSGTNNTAVGYYADVSTGNLTNAIAIGAGAVVTNSNAIRLGNTSIISLECQVGLSVTSDARFKYNVQQNVPGLDFIQKLKPVTYQVIETANVIKQILDEAGVTAYPKTSGSTGIHIYIPLGAKYEYEQSKMLAELVVSIAHRELPKFTSLERSPAKRKGKIYLDFLQNRAIQTIAAPYSLRPKPGATVSAPLHWDEVKDGLSMQEFTIFNMGDRLKKEGDLFQGILGKGIDLEKVLKKIDTIFS